MTRFDVYQQIGAGWICDLHRSILLRVCIVCRSIRPVNTRVWDRARFVSSRGLSKLTLKDVLDKTLASAYWASTASNRTDLCPKIQLKQLLLGTLRALTAPARRNKHHGVQNHRHYRHGPSQLTPRTLGAKSGSAIPEDIRPRTLSSRASVLARWRPRSKKQRRPT